MRGDVQNVKLVVVGDGSVGKTSMLNSYTTKRYNDEHVPTIFESKEFEVTIDDVPIVLDLWDTAGPEHFDRLRPLSYKFVDVFLLNFSCTSEISFDNVECRWLPELNAHQPGVPIVLVCGKCDLRNDEEAQNMLLSKHQNYVTLQDARDVMERHDDVVAVIENSAKTQEGLNETFEIAIQCSILKKHQFLAWLPFQVGDYVYAHHKGKRNIAIVREITATTVKVYYFQRPFWYNSQTIKKREKIEYIPPKDLLFFVFRDFHPFGFELTTMIVDHIAEYLPVKKYWK